MVVITATCFVAASTSAQTKTTQLIIAGPNGSIKLNSPNSPGSGTRSYFFPNAPNGSSFILSESTTGQTINGALTLGGPLTLGDASSLTLGGSTGNPGDVMTLTSTGGLSWQAPSGGGGGIPTSRTLTTVSPLKIDNALSADLSANRTLAFDFNVANSWLNTQTFQATTDQGNAFVTSINSANTAIGVAQGGTGKTTLTSNRLLLGNGTSAIGEVASGSNGDVLKLVGGIPTWQSAGSESILGDAITTTSTSLVDATGMSFEMGASETWEFTFTLKVGSGGGAGLQFAVDIPSGATIGATMEASGSGAVVTLQRIIADNIASSTVCNISDQNHYVQIRGYVTTGTSNGGTVQLRWLKVTSNTGTIHGGSSVKSRRVK